MMGSLWSRLTGRSGKKVQTELTKSLRIPVRDARVASGLREILRKHATRPDYLTVWLPALIGLLEAENWSAQEVEKVRAYADFYSGANERGYQRIVQKELVRADYALFMTACVACYLADRFAEGAQLLDAFEPNDDPHTDWREYAAFAGYIHVAAGRPIASGIAYFDSALRAGEFSPLLAVNAYPIYFEAGCLEQCAHLKIQMNQRCANDPEVIYASACVELARDYYAEGFRLMEARYQMPELALYMNRTVMTRPRWHGESIAGKRLLVHAEQGLGDLIMMVRYLPQLHAQGMQLLVDARPEAISLLEHNFPFCEFFAGDLKKPVAQSFDYWTGIMSLPFHFSTTTTSVPLIDGYLRSPDEQRSYWRERVRALAAGARLRVGLAWSGNPGHRADKRRSLSFDVLQPFLCEHSDVAFFSLQTQVPEIHPRNLLNVADELLTVADTAAVIVEMDLIISVDTSSAHLAGASGAPTWLMLPYRYEWRWGLEGPHNAWYRCVKVWRQSTNGAWSPLLQQVSAALKAYRSLKNQVCSA